MLDVYAAWIEGSQEADLDAIRRAMEACPTQPSRTLSLVPSFSLCVANSNFSHRHRDDPSLAPLTRIVSMAECVIWPCLPSISSRRLQAAAPWRRSILSESLLLKHQLLILNRSRVRAPNLRSIDRIIASLCAGLMRHGFDPPLSSGASRMAACKR